MAIMQHSIIFGGVNSADFDLYIGGEGTFNAPKRAVELVSVPGRNGEIAIDQGHFENIEVEYTVINQEADLDTFAAKLAGFRNAICALRGYQRLEDTFHPDEFRMVLFVDEMEVKPIEYATASEFKITFNCKPQRFLTSGETEIDLPSVSNTVTNPTLFASSPLIESVGNGEIIISSDNGNEYLITLEDDVVGDLTLLSPFTSTEYRNVKNYLSVTEYFAPYGLLVGTNDTMDLSEFTFSFTLQSYYGDSLSSLSLVYPNGHTIPNYVDTTYERIDEQTIRATLYYGAQSFTNSASYTQIEDDLRLLYTVKDSNDQSRTFTQNFTMSIGIENNTDGYDQYLAFKISDFSQSILTLTKYYTMQFTAGSLTCDSTASVLGNPTYIDCEIGEVYKELGDMVVSLNRYVSLGSDLPVLEPGDNYIRKRSGTWQSLKIVPRWWQI